MQQNENENITVQNENITVQNENEKTTMHNNKDKKHTDTYDDICDSLFNTRLPVDILIDKIRGLFYGCIIGEYYNDNTTNFKYLTEQMLMSTETVLEKSGYDPHLFLSKLKSYNGTHDKYTQEVLSTLDDSISARENSVNHYIKNKNAKKNGDIYTQTNSSIALVRSIPICLFYGFDDLSLISCMTTHANPICLISSVIFATIIRNILIGRQISYNDLLLCFKVSLMSSMRNIKHKEGYYNLINYIPNDNYRNLNNLQLSYNSNHAYKTVGVGIYSLMTIVEQNILDIDSESPTADCVIFNNVLEEIYNKSEDTSINCCIAGSIMGCYIGYNNLPLDKIPKFNTQDSLYIENIISLYLYILGIKK